MRYTSRDNTITTGMYFTASSVRESLFPKVMNYSFKSPSHFPLLYLYRVVNLFLSGLGKTDVGSVKINKGK